MFHRLSILSVLCASCLAGGGPSRALEPPPEAAPRDLETLKKELAEIARVPPRPEGADALTLERQAALRRLKAYRYLAGVPHEPLVLDDQLNRYAQAATAVCARLGRLSHDPPKPTGMAEELYKDGRKGANSSNLGHGLRDLTQAVDAWMNDSDPGNIAAAGHRRWCLNPALAKTGFGRTGLFTAMYVFDRSRKDVPAYDFLTYPARGPMPTSYFRRDWAWTVSLNPRKYREPDKKKVSVKVFALDKESKKTGAALALNYLGVDTQSAGVPLCVVFRPVGLQVSAGKRYLVEIEGLTGTDDKPAAVRFTTEFVSLK